MKQDVNTLSWIHDVRTIVSFIGRYVTLHPGDLIVTETTGRPSRSNRGTRSK